MGFETRHQLRTHIPEAEVFFAGKTSKTVQPKSVIRHAESVFDWESEAFGHLARLCPHPDSRSRYAFG